MRRIANIQLALLFSIALQANCVAQSDHKRLSGTEPESGRYVQTEYGYMLPYSEKIPGTDISFRMQPIRGGILQLESKHTSIKSDESTGKDSKLITIEIEPFWIGQYEVTWEEYERYARLYAAFKKIHGEKQLDPLAPDAVTAPTEIYDPRSRLIYATSPRSPATSMTQYAARQYTKWLSLKLDDQYRLPTEAEWSFACIADNDSRANLTPTKFFGFDILHAIDSEEGPYPVGQQKANAWLLHDMLGNVSEYVLDADGKSLNTRLPPGKYSNWESVGNATERFTDIVCGANCWLDRTSHTPAARILVDDDFWCDDASYPLSVSWLASIGKQEVIGFRLVRSLKDVPKEQLQKLWLPESEELSLDVEMKLSDGRGATGRVHLPPDTAGTKVHLPYLKSKK